MSMLMQMIVSATYLVFMIAQKAYFFFIHCIILFLQQLYKFYSNSGETEDKKKYSTCLRIQ